MEPAGKRPLWRAESGGGGGSAQRDRCASPHARVSLHGCLSHSKRVGMWFLTDLLCARRGISERGAWLDWWDRNSLEGGCIDWKESWFHRRRSYIKKTKLQSLLLSLLKELCRTCLSRSSLKAGQGMTWGFSTFRKCLNTDQTEWYFDPTHV